MNPPPATAVAVPRRRWTALAIPNLDVWLCAAAVALLVFSAKLLLIAGCGSDLPFWDQWDAEGEQLYLPFLEGRLGWTDLVEPHNEHRILFTRLLALGLLQLGGQWDALVQTVTNAWLHALTIGLLAGLARNALGRGAGTIAALVLAVVFALPLAWENTLSGFQSQFYFLLLFAVLHVAGTAYGADHPRRLWLAQLAGFCALFSMASGLASAAAVLALVLLRAAAARRFTRPDVLLLITNLGLLIAGLLLRVDHPGHETLRAASFAQFFSALAHVTAWPARSLLLAPLMIAPLVLLLWHWWRTPTPARTFWLGLGGWWMIQLLLLAYGRGAGPTPTAPRYVDLLLIGVAVGTFVWLDLTRGSATALPRLRGWFLVAAVGWGVAVGDGLSRGFVQVQNDVWPTLQRANLAREQAVRQYVAARSPSFFTLRPWFELPYPDPHRLAQFLDHPRLRRILAPSVRPAIPVELDPAVSVGVATGATPRAALGSFDWAGEPGLATRLVTRRFHSDYSRVLLPLAGAGATARLEDALLGGETWNVSNADRWQPWMPAVGRKSVRLVIEAPVDGWFAARAPTDLSYLGWLARLTLRHSVWWTGLGALVLVLSLAVPAARCRRPDLAAT